MLDERFFSNPDETLRLHQRFNISWRAIEKEMTSNVSALQREVAITDHAAAARTFHGPDGRRRLECAVHETLTSPAVKSMNGIMNAMQRAGLGLSESEAEVAAIAAAAAVQLASCTTAERSVGSCNREQANESDRLLLQWQIGYDDVTVSSARPRPPRPRPSRRAMAGAKQSAKQDHDDCAILPTPMNTASMPRIKFREKKKKTRTVVPTGSGGRSADGSPEEPHSSGAEMGARTSMQVQGGD